MATTESHKGLTVLYDDSGAQPGGQAISQNFRQIVDWYPQSNFAATANPTVDSDVTEGYYPGSLWYNTSNQTFWICTKNDDGDATWRGVTFTLSVNP